jgi:hypothetical protein
MSIPHNNAIIPAVERGEPSSRCFYCRLWRTLGFSDIGAALLWETQQGITVSKQFGENSKAVEYG